MAACLRVVLLVCVVVQTQCLLADTRQLRGRIEGMLMASLIGDAAGGPIEFKSPEEIAMHLQSTRGWDDDRKLTDEDHKIFAEQFKLLGYAGIRSEVAPFGPWTEDSHAGTITDDSRHKIVLMNAVRAALVDWRERGTSGKPFRLKRKQLAEAYVDFASTPPIKNNDAFAKLHAESGREYIQAARWVLGKRKNAIPPARIWGGVPNVSGQMALTPLAAIHAGQPNLAYRETFKVGFMDNGDAKDINSAIVAGLSFALVAHEKGSPQEQWEQTLKTMHDVDPYGYHDIPFVKRPVVEWIDVARKCVRDADGSPKKLFRLLEERGRPRFYWDAHFVLACSVAIIDIAKTDPLTSIHLALDFGHDTDSTAQLVGCFVGAIHGVDALPENARSQVRSRLKADYDQEVDEWVDLLMQPHSN